MKTDEIIHLISNQALNKDMTENNKLIIQNCCKELFEKKCKYKKIYYLKNKASMNEHDDLVCRTEEKTRIVEITGDEIFDDGDDLYPFPQYLHHKALESAIKIKYFTFKNCCIEDISYTILKIEDI